MTRATGTKPDPGLQPELGRRSGGLFQSIESSRWLGFEEGLKLQHRLLRLPDRARSWSIDVNDQKQHETKHREQYSGRPSASPSDHHITHQAGSDELKQEEREEHAGRDMGLASGLARRIHVDEGVH